MARGTTTLVGTREYTVSFVSGSQSAYNSIIRNMTKFSSKNIGKDLLKSKWKPLRQPLSGQGGNR